jgi:hypothetical protein
LSAVLGTAGGPQAEDGDKVLDAPSRTCQNRGLRC